MSVQSEYKKIRQALLAQIRYLRKQGYTVDIDVPPIPRKITAASIRRIQKVKSTVREHTSYKGAKGFGAFRKRRQERAAERPPKPPKPPKEKGPQGPYVYGPDGTPAEQEPEEELGAEEKPGTEEEAGSEGEPEEGPDVTAPEDEFYPGQDGYDSIYPEDVQEGEGMPEGPDWWPPEGEIIYDNLMNEINKALDAKSKWLKKRADYLLEELEKAKQDVDSFEQLLDNLANTDPAVIQQAQYVLYDSQGMAEDIKTHRFYELLKFGELLTEEEARRTDDSFFDDQSEDGDYIDFRYGNTAYDNGWTEESWDIFPG